MDIVKELRNEADGTYGRQPDGRYQRLLEGAAYEIEKLEKRIKQMNDNEKELVQLLRENHEMLTKILARYNAGY